MAVEYKPDGTVRADTVTEMAELFERVPALLARIQPQQVLAPARAATREPKAARSAAPTVVLTRSRNLVPFLQMVRDEKDHGGLGGTKAMIALKLARGAEMGSIMIALKHVVASMGLTVADVVTKRRDTLNGRTVYKGGPKLQTVIDALTTQQQFGGIQ